MKQNTINLNEQQIKLLKRALYGLKAYTEADLEKICSKKKNRILKVHKKAQNVLNLYKQEKTNKITNYLFYLLFPNSPISDFFSKNCFTDVKYKNTLTFKELKISNKELIDILIKNEVLPNNFYNLNNNNINLKISEA